MFPWAIQFLGGILMNVCIERMNPGNLSLSEINGSYLP